MATELAQAYVQIIPSAKGIGGNIGKTLEGEMGTSGETAGTLFSSKFATLAKVGFLAAGVALGKAVMSSIMEGAKLQQSMGGIETLFKDSYDKVIQYANNAYKTAGLSANSYMELITSFSASLLQSLDGDTNAAAESANMAITDMSDNVNKMGSNMEDIQNAYQGFAKQNYTMLDNLKLGYGGTKEEMERLLADAEKLSGQKYDISNLNDVYEAIHVIQTDLGITGTTAKEAATTFSGSFEMMKASAQNLLGAMSLGDQAPMQLEQAVSDLISSAITFLKNAIPMLVNAALAIPEAIFTAITSASESDMSESIDGILAYMKVLITERLPELASKGIEAIGTFAMGIIQGLPKILGAVTELVNNFIAGIDANSGGLIESAAQMIANLILGLIQNIPQIIVAAGKLVLAILEAMSKMAPQFLKMGIEVIKQLLSGIIQQAPILLSKIPGIIMKIVQGFDNIGSKMLSVGWNIVTGIWSGLSNKAAWLKNKIKEFVGDVTKFLKKLFKISSPSKLMRDEIGIYLAEGVGVGFSQGMDAVEEQMRSSIPTNFDVTPTMLNNMSTIRTEFGENNDLRTLGEYIVAAVMEQGKQLAEALQEGLSKIKMTRNDREIVRLLIDLGFIREIG